METRNAVAERAAKRRVEWEQERISRIWEMVDRGLLTEEEAKERLKT